MAAESNSNLWMIRTSENLISGPYSKKQVIQLIDDGQLELTDEICHANQYWIYLHEQEEVKRQLGIDIPNSFIEPEEPTQTETDTSVINSQSAPDAGNPSATTTMAAMGSRQARVGTQTVRPPSQGPEHDGEEDPTETEIHVDGVPELSVPADSIEEHTAVLSNRAFREFRPRENSQSEPTRVLSIHTSPTKPTSHPADAEGASPEEPPSAEPMEIATHIQSGEVSSSYAAPGSVEVTSDDEEPRPGIFRWLFILFFLAAAIGAVWYFGLRR
jgi:hypothetical protein